MKSRVFAVAAVAALVLSACGGDDDGGSGSPQGQVADMMIEALDESMGEEGLEGVEIDEDCLRDKAGELSDDDAQKILDAGPDGTPEGLSTDAEAIGNSILDCVDIDFSEIDLDE